MTTTEDRSRRAGIAAGVGLSALLVPLHVAFYRLGSGLWRDEVNLLNVVSFPTLWEAWDHFHLDSFPFAWLTLFHAWIRLLGSDDTTLRLFGLLAGLSLLPVAWWSVRRFGVEAPLVLLLLVGLNPSMVVFGDSIRGYGLGAVTIAWAVAAMWAVVERPRPRAVFVLLLAALAATQTYVPNGVLLAAAGLGATAVCWRRGLWRPWIALVAVGAGTCLALAPLVRWIRYAFQVADLEQGEWSIAWLAGVFAGALAPGVPALSIAWPLAALAALTGCAAVLGRRTRSAPDADTDRALFAAVTGVSALVLFFAYLRFIARLPTQDWYYLSLMVVLALCSEVGVWLLARRWRAGAWVRLAAVGVVAVLSLQPALEAVRVRLTNVDAIAAVLADSARPDDLVVVFPWVAGISFQRYYRGPAPWITLPDFDTHRFHLHLGVKERMVRGEAGVAEELARVEATLRGGGRVWIAGPLQAPDPGTVLTPLPPAPHGPRGWRAAPYLDRWELRLGELVRRHAVDVWRVDVPVSGRVLPWERLPLVMAEGWRASPP